jgi:hypothetical protein
MTDRGARLTLLLLSTAAVLLGGCGGGSGSTPGGGAPDTRAALFAAVETKLASFTGTDRDAENHQMLAFLKTKPEFVESGMDDSGVVWGYFADGSAMVVGNNLKVTNPVGLNRSAIVARSAAQLSSRAAGIPDSLRALVGTSLGPLYDTYTDGIRDMLDKQKYKLANPADTVDALKAMTDVSVLYMLGHGGTISLRNGAGKTYTIWTSTVRTPGLDAAYAADLKDGSLAWFPAHAFTGNEDTAATKVETHYGITTKFVQKYWTGKFNKTSMVFMNSCSSSSPAALSFGFACLSAGASVYFGWTDRIVLGDGIMSSAYMFDRLLGANKTNQINSGNDDLRGLADSTLESPPQRAFNYPAVLAEMGTRKRSYAAYAHDTSICPPLKPGGPPTPATLTMVTTNFAFGQLAPQIESLTVVEQKDELIVSGAFGDKPGAVFNGTGQLTVKEWTPNRITCALDRNAFGDVWVQVNNAQKSNVAQLSQWKGTAKATFVTRGTLKMEMNFNLHFRGDVRTRRIEPHGVALPFLTNYEHSLDSTGTYAFSGAYDSPDRTYHEDWSGSGSLPAFVKPPEGTSPPPVTSLLYQGSFTDKREWSLNILATGIKGHRIHTIIRDTQGKVVSDKTEDVDAVWQSLGDLNGHAALKTVPLNHDIPGGTVTNAINSTDSLTLTWSAMSAAGPPDPTAARSATFGRGK